MHIMGSTARQMGFDGPLVQLCDPVTGLHYGCLYLASLVKAHGLEKGLDAYNDGRADGKGPGSIYAVDILKRAKRFRNEFP